MSETRTVLLTLVANVPPALRRCEKTWPGPELRDNVYRQHRCGQAAGASCVCRYCNQPHPGGRWPK